ncbi:RNA polymerase sigma factor [Dyadobacter arcticus]|uniref:RNA polymerase sigma-70 factor (ECF subfamily) n=1 Tax=Dyadobacter arcticus TaxID=1078754 RepID=A0ABX0UUN7_9BACT|nr:RNA polymerase subunit sigma-24 [Dyadobacter arcticus]NIJ55934.1 RNA polymerase sigma-70 factor (ECF subfamily) [Dyadobacter arcticus]
MAFPYQQIVYQVTQGDEAAFTQLRTYLHVPAFKFCSVILKDETEAENIIHEVFAKIWDERVQLKPDENFQSYLFLNLKSQIFGRMTSYSDPIARTQYLERIHSFSAK